MRRTILLSFALAALVQLGGCGTIYKAAVDERDLGTFVNDGRIESAVRARFIDDPRVRLRDVSVNSYLGTVYVVGEFANDRQKMRARDLAFAVKGVRRVTVVPFPLRKDPTCGVADDMALYTKIKSRLVEDRDIWSTHVDIKTVDCNVVMLGLVKNRRESRAIMRHVNSVRGVRTVQNLMRAVGR